MELNRNSNHNNTKSRPRTIVKICGIRTPESALVAKESGADIIGMIFAPSPRVIDTATGQAISQMIKGSSQPIPKKKLTKAKYHEDPHEYFRAYTAYLEEFISTEKCPLLCGVFQNQSVEEINQIVEDVGLDLVQFHGNEPVEMANEINVPVIKVFHIESKGADCESVLAAVTANPGFHSIILLDTKVKGSSQQGGQGVSFDWNIAKEISDLGLPFIMAGGLDPDNVGSAIQMGGPWGVDVSSGTETNKVKDPAKIKTFVSNARELSLAE